MQVDKQFENVFYEARHIVVRYRYWFRKLTAQYDLHPVVEMIISKGIRPAQWQRLLLEWPHISTEDEEQIAYTRDEKKGEANVQTRTSIGKYLARHWPHVPDHIRRDWAGTYSADKFAIWDTKEQIICGIETGPRSCMKSENGNIPFTSTDNQKLMCYLEGTVGAETVRWNKHPYAVYAPELGWRMAVRTNPNEKNVVLGRAIVHEPTKCFVRTYARNESGGSYSSSDEKLAYWLTQEGYEDRDSWPNGVKFARLEHPDGGLMMPYLDGSNQRVEIERDYIVKTRSGIECSKTDGSISEGDPCEDCGDYMDDDERVCVGRGEDRVVCENCCTNNYTFVRGRGGRWGNYREYYVDNDSAVSDGNGTYYDAENLPESVVMGYDGDVLDIDEAVCVDGDYLHCDDERVVLRSDDEYAWRDNCWEDADGKWHDNGVESVETPDGTFPEEACWLSETGTYYHKDITICVEVDGKLYTQEELDAMRCADIVEMF